MSIEIRIIEEYDDAVFKDIVKRNLEDGRVFIDEATFRMQGDESFEGNKRQIRIGAFDNDKMIGLSWGKAATKNRFTMMMSCVNAEYRGQRIYSKMLDMMLNETKIYNVVDSFHHLFNNEIIATKLRRGFQLVGMTQSVIVGPLVELRYFHNQKLFEIMKFRVGLIENPCEQILSS